MRNATSREPLEGVPAELQMAREGCGDLGPQVESIAEQVVAALRQATQELLRLEAQRDELRRTARETPPPVFPKLLERIEEQGQCVKRLERASRGLKELMGALGGVGEHLRRALAHRDEDRHEQEALIREEKRMWLRELLSLRQRLEGAESAAERPRAEHEDALRLRAEREQLTQRVAELERHVSAQNETLQAKEQTLADLRRMILLLTPSPSPALETTPRPALKPSEQLFGHHTIQLAHHLLETLGPEEGHGAPPAPKPEPRRPTSREIRFGPLDEFAAGAPSMPPPVPSEPPAPPGVFAPTPPPAMPKAGARLSASARPPSDPTPLHSSLERPGTLVISEEMFNDVLAENEELGPAARK